MGKKHRQTWLISIVFFLLMMAVSSQASLLNFASAAPLVPVDQLWESGTKAEHPDAWLKSNASQENDSPIRETRAIWSRLGTGRTVRRADIDDLVATVDAANLNLIFLAVYTRSAYFETSNTRFPNDDLRLPNRSSFVDDERKYDDALAYLLAIRDQRRADDDPTNDFEVHAWFNVHLGGKEEKLPAYGDLTEPTMLNGIFPEFKMKFGRYYTVGGDRYIHHEVSVVHQPRFRVYMVDLIAGLVEDYEVDGVHLDHIRTGGICFNNEPLDYAGRKYDYPGCQQDYKNWTKREFGQVYSLYDDTDGLRTITDGGSGRVAGWEEQAVYQLVKEIRDEVKSVSPLTKVSVASVASKTNPADRIKSFNGQAAYEWLNDGIIDAVFVTMYHEETSRILTRVKSFLNVIPDPHDRKMVFPGLITRNEDGAVLERTDLLLEQVEALVSRGSKENGLNQASETVSVSGVALFRYFYLADEAVQLLAEGPFSRPAIPYWNTEPTAVHFSKECCSIRDDRMHPERFCRYIPEQIVKLFGLCPE